MLKNKSILKVVAILMVMIMSMYMLTGCGNNGDKKDNKNGGEATEAYSEPITNLVEGLSKADSAKLLSAFPTFLSEYMKTALSDEYLQTALDSAKEEYGDNVEMTYEIKGKEEISEDDLKATQDQINNTYGQDIKITKGYSLNVSITTKGDLKEDVDENDMNVYKIDDKWYLFSI